MLRIEANELSNAREFSAVLNGVEDESMSNVPEAGTFHPPPCSKPPCSCTAPCKPVPCKPGPPPPCKPAPPSPCKPK